MKIEVSSNVEMAAFLENQEPEHRDDSYSLPSFAVKATLTRDDFRKMVREIFSTGHHERLKRVLCDEIKAALRNNHIDRNSIGVR